ncbi:MAG: DUF362 domain-containing protein [Methanomassiliicoccus sp.]|nr:DUF362 domain-containing protein [Methanomassiliicoccus sp.]
MPSPKVSLVRCQSYAQENVDTAVRKCLDNLGGIERFIKPSDRVLLKPNLLIDAAPEECVTTRPAVMLAVGRMVRDRGCQVTIADSPGSFLPYTQETLERVYRKTGMLAVAEELGVDLNYGTGHRDAEVNGGRALRNVKLIDPVAEADAIIVLSKLKTHLATGLTGGAKNIYGVVPGLEKKALHARFRTPARFAEVLVDINELVKPKLQIMDAVMAMEGDGPTSGRPKAMNAILAADSPYAIDAVAARLMRLDPMRVTTVHAASDRALIDVNEVEVVGEPIDSIASSDFALPCTFASAESSSFIKRTASSAVSRLGLDRARPVIAPDVCRGCGACAKSCPAEAIQIIERKARIDRRKCIECYCCHEMCKAKAIRLEKGSLGRVLDRAVTRGTGGG